MDDVSKEAPMWKLIDKTYLRAREKGGDIDYLILGISIYLKVCREFVNLTGFIPKDYCEHKILVSYKEKDVIAFVETKIKIDVGDKYIDD